MDIYSTLSWQTTRAIALKRDGRRCTVSRLLGGKCSAGPLHVHHIVPVSEGGAPYDAENTGTTCAAHHPMWEALRRHLVRRLLEGPPRCPHYHQTAEGRRQCERRLARQRGRELDRDLRVRVAA